MYKSAIHPGQVLSIPRYTLDDDLQIVNPFLKKKANTKLTTSAAKERVRSGINRRRSLVNSSILCNFDHTQVTQSILSLFTLYTVYNILSYV